MIIKLIGSALIVCATAIIGFDKAAKLERRKRSLSDFIAALIMLESEISFISSPLKSAFSTISKGITSQTGAFFGDISNDISGSTYNIKSIWDKALDKYAKSLALTQTDVGIISAFSTQLGKTDRENQLKNIYHTKAQLGIQLNLASEICSKNKKVYQSFGILSGILIAILLF